MKSLWVLNRIEMDQYQTALYYNITQDRETIAKYLLADCGYEEIK